MIPLTPVEFLTEQLFDRFRDLAGAREPSRRRLVIDDFTVNLDLEHPLGARAKLDAGEDRRPSICYLRCHTDSFIEIVSRDAVFDDDGVLRSDHLTT